MDPITLSKRHLIQLALLTIAITLVIGWFVGVFFFQGASLSKAIQDAHDKSWFNIMTGEDLPISIEDGWMTDAATKFGEGASTYAWATTNDGLVIYANKRAHYTLSLPQRTRMTTEVTDNPGVPVLVYEDGADTTKLMEGAVLLNTTQIVASANMSSLPIYVRPPTEQISAKGLGITVISNVTEDTLGATLETAFPKCSVTAQSLEKTSFDGTFDVIPTFTPKKTGVDCGLSVQPVLKFSPVQKELIITATNPGCRFRPPNQLKSDIVQVCSDDAIFASIHFTD